VTKKVGKSNLTHLFDRRDSGRILGDRVLGEKRGKKKNCLTWVSSRQLYSSDGRRSKGEVLTGEKKRTDLLEKKLIFQVQPLADRKREGGGFSLKRETNQGNGTKNG